MTAGSPPAGAREIRAALAESRRLFGSIGLFSAFVNLLMLTGPLFMLQVYDRVLTSRSEATLVALIGIAAHARPLPGEGRRAGVPPFRRPGALPARGPRRLGADAPAPLDLGRRQRRLPRPGGAPAVAQAPRPGAPGSGPMRGAGTRRRTRLAGAVRLAVTAAAVTAAVLAGTDLALATTDTTFGDPLGTVTDIVGGTGGQLAAALAVGAALVGSVLRFNAMQLMGAVGVGIAAGAGTGIVTGLVGTAIV